MTSIIADKVTAGTIDALGFETGAVSSTRAVPLNPEVVSQSLSSMKDALQPGVCEHGSCTTSSGISVPLWQFSDKVLFDNIIGQLDTKRQIFVTTSTRRSKEGSIYALDSEKAFDWITGADHVFEYCSLM